MADAFYYVRVDFCITFGGLRQLLPRGEQNDKNNNERLLFLFCFMLTLSMQEPKTYTLVLLGFAWAVSYILYDDLRGNGPNNSPLPILVKKEIKFLPVVYWQGG